MRCALESSPRVAHTKSPAAHINRPQAHRKRPPAHIIPASAHIILPRAHQKRLGAHIKTASVLTRSIQARGDGNVRSALELSNCQRQVLAG
jgi:hypothetical protein